MSTITLVYLGDPKHPERRGVIEGVTPHGNAEDGILPGLEADHGVEISDALLASLNRPMGEGKAQEFAEYLAGVYNANYPTPKWEVDVFDPTQGGVSSLTNALEAHPPADTGVASVADVSTPPEDQPADATSTE